MAELLFYLLAIAAVAAGLGVVLARNPLFSVLSLLGAFFCLASIYLLMGFQFLAATQLLVYAGAIMVLFLFVIMLLNLGDDSGFERGPGQLDARGRRRYAIAGATAGVLLLVAAFSVGLKPVEASEAARAADHTLPEHGYDDLHSIAELLFSRYVVPFEAASLLLLATMIAVILLAKRQRGEGREGPGYPWQSGGEG